MTPKYLNLSQKLKRLIENQDYEGAETCELDLAKESKNNSSFNQSVAHWLMADYFRMKWMSVLDAKFKQLDIEPEEFDADKRWCASLSINKNLRTTLEKSTIPLKDFEIFVKRFNKETKESDIYSFIDTYYEKT